ncbi:MAG TPA: hypothetical protein VKM93_20970 [Terriglobia bacterium]|nr:hypothetical protein [Terriglobia bacterium]
MTDVALKQEIDANPLTTALVEKTKAGRIGWQATANENTFIASVGGDTTLRLTLESVVDFDPYGQPESYDVPVLCLLDSKGKTLWEVHSREVKGGLWPLYKLAQRIANKVDEKVEALMEALQKL